MARCAAALAAVAARAGFPLVAPPVRLCTDNAVMVAWAGIERLRLGLTDPLDLRPARAGHWTPWRPETFRRRPARYDLATSPERPAPRAAASSATLVLHARTLAAEVAI